MNNAEHQKDPDAGNRPIGDNGRVSSRVFSPFVISKNLVFVSGTIGISPATDINTAEDIGAQTERAIENIRGRLEACGCTLEHILKATVFLVNMDLYDSMLKAYQRFFREESHAWTCVGIESLPNEKALVEIEVVAYKGD